MYMWRIMPNWWLKKGNINAIFGEERYTTLADKGEVIQLPEYEAGNSQRVDRRTLSVSKLW